MRRTFILAAGLGTRLKPWTDSHPKALVPVGGQPMLERVLTRVRGAGFDGAVVNVHHFAEQIEDFLGNTSLGLEVRVSDEREELLETGGGLLKAAPLLFSDGCEAVLVHNADILSNANLTELFDTHLREGNDVTLLVSGRESSRRLWFTKEGRLCGWENLKTGDFRPEGFQPDSDMTAYAFSGIYVVGRRTVELMNEKGYSGRFPIMDFFLREMRDLKICAHYVSDLELIDIGKPETLEKARLAESNQK